VETRGDESADRSGVGEIRNPYYSINEGTVGERGCTKLWQYKAAVRETTRAVSYHQRRRARVWGAAVRIAEVEDFLGEAAGVGG
jgi:hypothetical protein